MKPARYIFLNKALGMSAGKAGAQAAHAEMLAAHDYFTAGQEELDAWKERQRPLYEEWHGGGHYVKYVMEVENSTAMFTHDLYLKERGFKTYFVIDEGRTEGTFMVPTAIAVELVDKDDPRVASTFATFRLYKEDRPKGPPEYELVRERRPMLFFIKALDAGRWVKVKDGPKK